MASAFFTFFAFLAFFFPAAAFALKCSPQKPSPRRQAFFLQPGCLHLGHGVFLRAFLAFAGFAAFLTFVFFFGVDERDEPNRDRAIRFKSVMVFFSFY